MSDEHVTLPDDDPDEPTADDTAASGESAEALPEPAADPEPTTCAECGAAIEPEQQYCLECGAPTPFAVPLRARKNAGTLVVASLLALGIGAGALIYALTKEDKGPTIASASTGTTATLPPFTQSTAIPTNPFPTTNTFTFPTTTGFTTPTTETTDETDLTDDTATDIFTDDETTDTTTSPTTTPTTDTGTTDGGDDDWTATTSKYTIILRSYDTRADAEDEIDRIRDSGQTAGLIVSDNYESLNPGWYVVYRGVYDTKALADQALPAAKRTHPSAYVRLVAA